MEIFEQIITDKLRLSVSLTERGKHIMDEYSYLGSIKEAPLCKFDEQTWMEICIESGNVTLVENTLEIVSYLENEILSGFDFSENSALHHMVCLIV